MIFLQVCECENNDAIKKLPKLALKNKITILEIVIEPINSNERVSCCYINLLLFQMQLNVSMYLDC
ncbi:hypothetical protein Syun_007329 [Stephania yunnanensis]|uniref:Uncharacterized protein n=1 Tax=Stephania yunnanensis TaxID=152371 RepID=A0AAP0PYL2_9MAGN